MGSRASKQAVSIDNAKEGLQKEFEIEIHQLEAYFDSIAKKDNNSKEKLVAWEKLIQELELSGTMWNSCNQVVKNRIAELLFDPKQKGFVGFDNFLFVLYICISINDALRQRFLFQVFDSSGLGNMDKKQFRVMCEILLVGEDQPQDIDSNLSPVLDLMVDSAILLFDLNRDGKLNYDEWIAYSQQEDMVISTIDHLKSSNASEVLGKIAVYKKR